MRPLYSDSDRGRVLQTSNPEGYREEWRRDYARLIHSAGFRRLQGKTQVFPGHEGDFFRNRLTHSLEVAQIAKSIAIRLNATSPYFEAEDQKLSPDIVEFAGLAHDLGHPPFGHNGEEALDECMRKSSGGFEGNAQTLRILSKLEKKVIATGAEGATIYNKNGEDLRRGLNLTYRSLAAILKYDDVIPLKASDRKKKYRESVQKGYYSSEKNLVSAIKNAVIGNENSESFKTVECSIMDIADDIAYSTYDLEDIFKSGVYGPLDLFTLPTSIYEAVRDTINSRIDKQYKGDGDAKKVNLQDINEVLLAIFKNIFQLAPEDVALLKKETTTDAMRELYTSVGAQRRSRRWASDGYDRTNLTSYLVGLFLDGIEVKPHEMHPQLHKVRLKYETFVYVETLKNITYQAVIKSPALQVVEYRGKDMIKKIFNALTKDDGYRLMPADFRDIYLDSKGVERDRIVCDFIAGMTDRYAIEFYNRLFGAKALTMHKPL